MENMESADFFVDVPNLEQFKVYASVLESSELSTQGKMVFVAVCWQQKHPLTVADLMKFTGLSSFGVQVGIEEGKANHLFSLIRKGTDESGHPLLTFFLDKPERFFKKTTQIEKQEPTAPLVKEESLHPFVTAIVESVESKKSLARDYQLNENGMSTLHQTFVKHFSARDKPNNLSALRKYEPLADSPARPAWRYVQCLLLNEKWHPNLQKSNNEYKKLLLTFVNTFGYLPSNEHILFFENAFKKPRCTTKIIIHTMISYYTAHRKFGPMDKMMDELEIHYKQYLLNEKGFAGEVTRRKQKQSQKKTESITQDSNDFF